MFGGLTSALNPLRAVGDRSGRGDQLRSRTAAVTIAPPKGSSARWGTSSTLPKHRVRVVGVRPETDDVVTLLLEPVNGKPVPFTAGQYLTHCFEIDDTVTKRAYSISVAEGDELACTIKAIEGGVVSAFVNTGIKAGYEYTVIGPSGDFVLPADPGSAEAPLAFLAAGSGITPVMAMIDTALRDNPDRVVDLVYASRRQSAIIFADRLAELEARHPGFTVTHVLSRPDGDWPGLRGRLDDEQAAKLLRRRPDAEIYLCGPGELMASTTAALIANGVEPARIHSEQFFAAAQHTAPLPTMPQPIEFRRSNLTIVQEPGETILEAGLRNGIPLDFSCTVGGCGACKIRMVSGAITVDEPNCLTDEEKAAGYTLGCSAYALEPAVVDA